MVRQRVRRLANPRRTRKARASRSRLVRNRKGQFIKRSAARRKRATAAAPRRRRARVSSPRRRVRVTTRSRARSAPRKRRNRRSNPVLVTLGMVNPQKRRTSTVARRTRKRRNPVSRRRRRNATRRIVVVTAPRRRRNRRSVRASGRRRNPHYTRRRRNPELFGSRLGSRASLEMVLGGLIGVTAAKLIPGLLPASLLGSPIMRIVVSGASAWAAGMVGAKVSGPFGNAVLFGGLMQTGSLALNAFVPSIGGQIGLRGLGDIVPGYFPVPQNPIYPGNSPMIAAPTTARTGANGIGRAWGPAWGA